MSRPVDPALVSRFSAAAEELLGGRARARAAALSDPTPTLPAPEEAAVSRAVDKRRREFAHGRSLARALLAELGLAVEALPRGPDRAPIWPGGAWGSISHTDELVVVAVTRAPSVGAEPLAFGLDVEGSEPLDDDLAALVLSRDELARLPEATRSRLAKVAFSGKEAFYKAQYPITGLLLGFLDVSLELDAVERRFAVTVHRADAREALRGRDLKGAWREVGGFVLSVATAEPLTVGSA